MGREAAGSSWTGGQPGRDHGLPRPPGLPAGFDHGGRRETAAPVYGCDHRYQVGSYLPGDRLRRLVQVRGWHVWKTPTGRTYVQEPWRYTA
jgi:hypothetical protein